MLQPGTQVGGYLIESVLGHGGMSVVYEARQLALDRKVAFKLLAPHLAADADFRERFRHEGRLQATLDHPHIVTVYEAGEIREGLYLAMRFIRGATLKDLIIARELDGARTIKLLEPIADALDTAHEAGLIHRDVKPQNILVDRRDHAYLADFGLMKGAQSRGMTRAGQLVGTVDYISPEQIRGEDATTASDVYSFAAVVFEGFTGVIPYARASDAAVMYAHLTDEPPRVTDHRPDLPAELDEVLARGMAKAPSDRHGSVGELIRDAGQALGKQVRAVITPPDPIETPEQVGFRRPESQVPTQPGPTITTSVPSPPPPGNGGPRVPVEPAAVAAGDVAAEALVGEPVVEPPADEVVEAHDEAPEESPVDEVVEAPLDDVVEAPEESPVNEVVEAPVDEVVEALEDEAVEAPEKPPADEPDDLEVAEPGDYVPGATVISPRDNGPGATVISPPVEVPGATVISPRGEVPGATIVSRLPPPAEPPADEAESPERRRGGLIAAVTVVAALLAGAVGYAVGHSPDPIVDPGPPDVVAETPSVALKRPGSWGVTDAAPVVPGLALLDSVAFGPGDASGAGIVAGRTQAPVGPALLPSGFVERVAGPLPEGEPVQIGDVVGLRYRDLRVEGFGDRRLSVYVIPTTTGVATAGCYGSVSKGDCERVIGSLELKRGDAVPLGADPDYAETLNGDIAGINEARRNLRNELRRAKTPAAQAKVARRLAAEHLTVAQSVSGREAPPAAADVQVNLAAALRATADAYSALAAATKQHKERAYDAARKDVAAGETEIRRAIKGLAALGYGVS